MAPTPQTAVSPPAATSDGKKRAMDALERRFASDTKATASPAAASSGGKKRAMDALERRFASDTKAIASPEAAASGGKKRALDALERRFASATKAAAAEEQGRDLKSKARERDPHEVETGSAEEENKKNSAAVPSSPRTSSTPQQRDTGSHKPAPHKGHLVFSGYNPSREASGATESHPAYLEISDMIHENLLPAGNKASSNGDIVSTVVHNLLQSGDKGHQYIRGSRSMKIDNCLLLDNFVPRDHASVNARVKALQSHSKRSRRHMSHRQHRKCGSFDLLKEFHKFDLFKPMHEMWKEYISELLKETEKKQLAQCLLLSDLHGAILLVVECKTTALKGIAGIMIRETAETFGIITQDNWFRVVPKRGSVFIFQAGCWKITLHGDKLSMRNTVT